MELHLAMWVVFLLMFFSHPYEPTTKYLIGASTHNQTASKRPKKQSLKSWSMPMIRVEDYKARQNLGQNKSATQQWVEMMHQSRERLAYLNHQSNHLVGVEAWDLPRLVESKAGTYLVEIEIGSPPQVTTFLVDTGSHLIWMQAEPCNPCNDGAHNPYPVASQGSFVGWVKCAEEMCRELGFSVECNPNPLLGEDCKFNERYIDDTTIGGRMGIDTINYNNDGIAKSKAIHLGMAFEVPKSASGHDGILGLDRSPLGLSFQLESEFDNVFSLCMVNPNSGGTSKFTMGGYPPALSQHLAYTPMEASTFWMNSHYFVTLQGIAVGGEVLRIDPSIFKQFGQGLGGTLIDSGAPITVIPEAAFTAVVNAYYRQVRKFRVITSPPTFPFCYDISLSMSRTPPILPDLTFKFANNVDLVVTSAEAFIIIDVGTRMCLAMNYKADDDEGFSYIGNIFMQNQYVVYDNRHNTIGIASWNCLSA